MSQHNIVGSEAFDRSPFVLIRSVPTGSLRRRKSRAALAFVAGVALTLIGAVVTGIAVFGPGIAGA